MNAATAFCQRWQYHLYAVGGVAIVLLFAGRAVLPSNKEKSPQWVLIASEQTERFGVTMLGPFPADGVWRLRWKAITPGARSNMRVLIIHVDEHGVAGSFEAEGAEGSRELDFGPGNTRIELFPAFSAYDVELERAE